MIRKRKPWWLLGGLALAAGLYLLLYVFGVGCLFRRVTGIPCPGCGMTRAWLSLLRGDLAGMLYHHPMAPAIPVLLGYIWKDGQLLKNRRANGALLILIGAGFALTYAWRLAFWKAGYPVGF